MQNGVEVLEDGIVYKIAKTPTLAGLRVQHENSWVLHGKVFYLFKGKIESTAEMRFGKQHGLFTLYHENGKVKWEQPHIDGKKHGVWKIFAANGALLEEREFFEGKGQGFVKQYYETQGSLNGPLEFVYHRVDWKKEGDWIYYYRNGKIKSKTTYKDGTQVGKTINYDN